METITVLVVDNDRAANRTLQDDLSDVGFNVLTTNTELDGLEELQYGTNIDVVLLDYNAPRLNDSHTLRHLNTQFPKAKAIGMTRYDSTKLANIYRNDVEKLLPHPIHLSDLVAAIHSVLGLSVPSVLSRIGWSRRVLPEAKSKGFALRSRGAQPSRDRYWKRLTRSTILFLIASYAILKIFGLLMNAALSSN